MLVWIINVVVALLAALNAIAWSFTIREVGDPQLSINFLLRLVFNKWFIIAMVSAFAAAILSYAVLKEMGVLAGRFFLSLQMVATIVACTLVLGEKPSLHQWAGIVLIISGVLLLGRS